MQSAHALAMSELKETRARNQAELERRKAEVRRLEPRFATIETELMRGGNMLLRAVLDGNRDFEKAKRFIQGKQREKGEILKALGFPYDYLDEIYNCPNCRDTGFDDEGLKCHCLKALTSKYVSQNSNMTELMKEQTFESFDYSLFSPMPQSNGKAPLDIVNKVTKYAKDFSDTIGSGANMLIRGSAGTGKTYLSSCIGNRALKNGKTVYYQTSYKLCELLESIRFGKFDDDDDRENAVSVQKYINTVDLLIIDDLGTEFLTQFTAAALFDLINTRLLTKKSTVISTNLDFNAMDSLYSARLTSRIIGEYNVVIMPNGDLRRKKFK